MNNKKALKLYVMGGIFETTYFSGGYKERFCLISPSGKHMIPYIWTDPEKAFSNCKHHSHLYELSEDCTKVKLIRPSVEAPLVKCPDTFDLPEEIVNQLKMAINFDNILY